MEAKKGGTLSLDQITVKLREVAGEMDRAPGQYGTWDQREKWLEQIGKCRGSLIKLAQTDARLKNLVVKLFQARSYINRKNKEEKRDIKKTAELIQKVTEEIHNLL